MTQQTETDAGNNPLTAPNKGMDQVQGPFRKPPQKQEETGQDAQLQHEPMVQMKGRSRGGITEQYFYNTAQGGSTEPQMSLIQAPEPQPGWGGWS